MKLMDHGILLLIKTRMKPKKKESMRIYKSLTIKQ